MSKSPTDENRKPHWFELNDQKCERKRPEANIQVSGRDRKWTASVPEGQSILYQHLIF